MSSKNKKTKKSNNKKVLDGVNLVKEEVNDFNKVTKDIREDIINEEIIEVKKIKEEKVNNSTSNINDKIQSIISILFTVVIFLLILVLIFVLYNKFLKKNDINKENICQEYIKKDYNINNDDILEYIKDNRFIIYNIDTFDSNNIDKETINNFSKFIIWNSDGEYSLCDNHEYCLDTKKEMDYDTLKDNLLYYFNLDSLNLVFDYNFNQEDATRLFINDNKVILTFKSMEYETFKHDIVDIRIDENNIYIIFALSRRINDKDFSYIGYKNLHLLYDNHKFIIKNIKTTKN